MVVLCCIVVVTGFLPFPVSRSSLSSPPSQVYIYIYIYNIIIYIYIFFFPHIEVGKSLSTNAPRPCQKMMEKELGSPWRILLQVWIN